MYEKFSINLESVYQYTKQYLIIVFKMEYKFIVNSMAEKLLKNMQLLLRIM